MGGADHFKSRQENGAMNSNDDLEDPDNPKEVPDEKVGYGRPPKKHRFKKGQSGNPRGRPKGSENEASILLKLLRRKIALQDNGKPMKVSAMEAVLLRNLSNALKGDIQAAKFLLDRMGKAGVKYEPPEPPADIHKMSTEEKLAAFRRRLSEGRRR
jgi:hypothetical protein